MKGSRQRLWKLKPEICRLFVESSLTIQQIADTVNSTYRHTWNTISKNFSRKERTNRKKINYSKSKSGCDNPQYGKVKEESTQWNGGRVFDGKGYIMITKPSWYTARKGSKYIYEHHYVYCYFNKITNIPKGYCVHHKDENKKNNTISNLLLLTLAEHTKLHHRLRKGAETIPKGSRCQAASKYSDC